MIYDIVKGIDGGTVSAVSSKSCAHRALIGASFSDCDSTVICDDINDDIVATVSCLCALGAKIVRSGNKFEINPIDLNNLPESVIMNCNESGSTFRFFIPIVAALGINARFNLSGRLANRPITPITDLLSEKGITFSWQDNSLLMSGIITDREYTVTSDISSQFLTGMLLALPLIKGEKVSYTDTLASKKYIDITLNVLKSYGVLYTRKGNQFILSENSFYKSNGEYTVEGDWSNSAFWLISGAIGNSPVTVKNLNVNSPQGDKAILDILNKFGARVETNGSCITVFPSKLTSYDIDASEIPDLVPAISVLASFSTGKTVIIGVSRLRYKESDRVEAIESMIKSLSGKVETYEDKIVIEGAMLSNGTVDSYNDHRIAMSAAISGGKLSIINPMCVKKSYPKFWDDFQRLGGKFIERS